MTAKHPPNVQNYIKTPSEVAEEQVNKVLIQLCGNCRHSLKSHGTEGCEMVIEGCPCGECEEVAGEACTCTEFSYPSSLGVQAPKPDRDEKVYYLSGYIYFKKANHLAYTDLISVLPRHLEGFTTYVVPWGADEEDEDPCEYTERLTSRDRTDRLEAVYHLKACDDCQEHVKKVLQFTSTETGVDFNG